MKEPKWDPADSVKCQEIWEAYQREHDVSSRHGQTAGIDPKTGRIWFGESIEDVLTQREAEGLKSPMFWERVGHAAYFLKKGAVGGYGKTSGSSPKRATPISP